MIMLAHSQTLGLFFVIWWIKKNSYILIKLIKYQKKQPSWQKHTASILILSQPFCSVNRKITDPCRRSKVTSELLLNFSGINQCEFWYYTSVQFFISRENSSSESVLPLCLLPSFACKLKQLCSRRAGCVVTVYTLQSLCFTCTNTVHFYTHTHTHTHTDPVLCNW